MFGRLFLLFTLVPLVELYLLVRIGDRIGFLPTLAGVVLMGVLGAALARREGFRVLREWQGALAEGRMPSEGALGGVLVLLGGALLVLPGVLSDVVGLALLVPQTRRLVARHVQRRLERALERGTVHVYGFPGVGGPFGDPFGPTPPGPRRPGPHARPRADAPSVIDVEGEVVEEGPRRIPR